MQKHRDCPDAFYVASCKRGFILKVDSFSKLPAHGWSSSVSSQRCSAKTSRCNSPTTGHKAPDLDYTFEQTRTFNWNRIRNTQIVCLQLSSGLQLDRFPIRGTFYFKNLNNIRHTSKNFVNEGCYGLPGRNSISPLRCIFQQKGAVCPSFSPASKAHNQTLVTKNS